MIKKSSEKTVHPNLAKHFIRTKTRKCRSLNMRRIIRTWPLLVWLAAIAVVVVLHSNGTTFGDMTGVVEIREELVAPLESARLIEINVTIGQQIKAGDIIAQMDTSMLEASKATAIAEQQEAQNSIAGYQQDILQLSQQFNGVIQNAETQIINIQIDKASNLAELTELKKEQQRRETLADQNIINRQELSELRPEIAGLQQRVDAYPSLLEIHKQQLNTAKTELDDLKRWLRLENNQKVSNVIQAKMQSRNQIIEAQLAMLNLQIKNCTLTASRNGIVARIEAQPGDIIQAGQVVVRVVSEESNRVVGFLPEAFLGSVEKGNEALIWRERDGKQMDAIVESIAPDVRTLPQRISPMNSQTIRGRRIVLTVAANNDLIPGETVRIQPRKRSILNFNK
jgi:multidrug resistance efflux pump